MPWTVDELRSAYRLTVTEELTARALTRAVEQVDSWLGMPAHGGTVRWRWDYRLLGRITPYVSLPDQCAELTLVETLDQTTGVTTETIEDAWLANNGWSVHRTSIFGFRWFALRGDALSVTGRAVDDTATRDAMAASLALEQMGYDLLVQGRGWRRLLRDRRRQPTLPGMLPTSREVVEAGTGAGGALVPGTERIYIGLLRDPAGVLSLAGLREVEGLHSRLPTWTGKQYLAIARRSSRPVRSIIIAGFDQLPAFRSEVLHTGGVDWTFWISRAAWDGSIASDASVVVEG